MGKLYNAFSHDHLPQVCSQLAMLTVAVDTLTTQIHGAQHPQASAYHGLDPNAPVFTPKTLQYTSECGVVNAAGHASLSEQTPSTEAIPGDVAYNKRVTEAAPAHEVLSASKQVLVNKAPQALHQWEPLDPWLFLDRVELGRVSSTCKANLELVSSNTPFTEFSLSTLSNDQANDSDVICRETHCEPASVSIVPRDDERQGDACIVVGGPPALDEALIYSDEEVATICDALVAPLAREIHMFDHLEEFPRKLTSDGAKHGLGKLLRDICAKIVPLTPVLQARREFVRKEMASIGRRREGYEEHRCHQ